MNIGKQELKELKEHFENCPYIETCEQCKWAIENKVFE